MGSPPPGELMLSGEPGEAARVLRAIAGEIIDDLDRVVPDAACGHHGAVREYVRSWRLLERQVLETVHAARPDVVVRDATRGYVVVDTKRGKRGAPGGKKGARNALLDKSALDAPFTSWVSDYGPGIGVAMTLVAHLQSYVPGQPERASWRPVSAVPFDCDEFAIQRFLRRTANALSQDQELDRIAELFHLTTTDLASLFGVTRQAVTHWREESVPAARAEKVTAIARIADVLERNLKPERIPAVVRQRAEAYGGRSMLEMIREDRHVELLERVTEAFDWAQTA